MKKLSILIVGIISIGCAYNKPLTYSEIMWHPAYQNASLGNREYIMMGKIVIGMSIEECKVAWPGNIWERINATQDKDSYWELWRVYNQMEGRHPSVKLYLHLRNGRIVIISDHREIR
jgi:hypothetical protein